MDPVGEQLRQAREAQGLSLGDIAAVTKISVAALTALERGDVLRLPGGIFGRSFVRAYAIQVGLDPDAITKGFAAAVAEAERDSARKRVRSTITPDDREFAERQRRAIALLRRIVIVVAALSVALLLWQMWAWLGNRGATEPGPTPPPVPVDSRPPETLPGAAPAVALPDPPAPPGRTTGLAVTLRADAACWTKVTADGLVVFQRLLSPGEQQDFKAARELVLDVGSAGAVTWTINGRPARAIGEVGAHRVVRVTLDNVEVYLREG
jgi:transcriptional regulator with XRE-family HTH domain